jgi:hypothetical protein
MSPQAPPDAHRIDSLIAGEPAAHVVAHDGAQGILIQVDGSSGQVAGTVLLSTRTHGPLPPRITTPSFYIYTNIQKFDVESIDRVTHVIQTIARRDDGSLGFEREPYRHVPESLDTLGSSLLVAIALAPC